jgi:hypothetical protein
MKINSSFSTLMCSLALSTLIPVACSGDSNENGDGGAGTGGDEGGSGGKGGSGNTGGTGATGGASGGSSGATGKGGKGGTSGASGTSGTSGEAGTGGVGASGGEGGSFGGEAGESGAGGAPSCTIATNATVSGTLKITADDYFRLYVNGALIDETQRLWTSPQTYTVSVFRHPSRKNVIAVDVLNAAEIDGLDRGVVVDLSFDAGAGAQSVLSDATWKLSPTLVASWFDVAFVDTAWVAATDEGAHGISPYGHILGTSSARWIWSYDSAISATLKPTTEQVWVRKTFYVDESGRVGEAPTACP